MERPGLNALTGDAQRKAADGFVEVVALWPRRFGAITEPIISRTRIRYLPILRTYRYMSQRYGAMADDLLR